MHDENGRLLAVMSNPLLRRKLSLDVMQQHIFHLAIGQIEEPWDDKEKLPVFEIRNYYRMAERLQTHPS